MFSWLAHLAQRARTQAWARWLLSRALGWFIPFNGPHRFRVVRVEAHALTLKLPYRRANRNHLKGLHACALITLAELTSGACLLLQVDPRRYRIILQKLQANFHYQARRAAYARFEAPPQWVQDQIVTPLGEQQKVSVPCTVELHDEAGHHLATAQVHWQFKAWQSVQTR